MPALDFREIPEAHLAGGSQETFEFLAKDFFRASGFEIERGPDRGQDDGRDLLVIERREGVLGTTRKRWLVSCKHKAHSGSSVNRSDEEEVSDRVRSHGAHGFIGFYSTAISSPLERKLEGLKDEFEVKVLGPEDIEAILLNSLEGRNVARRYFPDSYIAWEHLGTGPANFLNQYEPLNCIVCGRDLLEIETSSNKKALVAWVREEDEDYEVRRYIDFYWACKGECDKMARSRYLHYSTSWGDITDILIPTNYVKWHIGIMNAIYEGRAVYNREAFERIKEFTIKIAQLTVRNQTESQYNRLAALAQLPPGI